MLPPCFIQNPKSLSWPSRRIEVWPPMPLCPCSPSLQAFRLFFSSVISTHICPTTAFACAFPSTWNNLLPSIPFSFSLHPLLSLYLVDSTHFGSLVKCRLSGEAFPGPLNRSRSHYTLSLLCFHLELLTQLGTTYL